MAFLLEHEARFLAELEQFKEMLNMDEVNTFRETTFESMQFAIGDVQYQQHQDRQMRDMSRMKPFWQGIKQYDDMIRKFTTQKDIMAFIWGSVKFLIEETATHPKAFEKVIDAYDQLGKSLPLLADHEHLLQDQTMIDVLLEMYKDILEFHSKLIGYFKQPIWRELFNQTWEATEGQIERIFSRLDQNKNLIETDASSQRIQTTQRETADSRREDDQELVEKENNQLRLVNGWLKAAASEAVKHKEHRKIREENPESGKWLLNDGKFDDWFRELYPTVPTLLWLTGKPGAGKTTLASLVIDEAEKHESKPTVLYFYCGENPEQNTLLTVLRTLLQQILSKHRRLLLDTIYTAYCRSPETVLSSPDLAKELLRIAFKRCKTVYIILDGLDECERDPRKQIAIWFRSLAEDPSIEDPERIRCLFVSQDDGAARKDFSGLSKIEVTSKQNTEDIESFSAEEMKKVRNTFRFSEEDSEKIIQQVSKSVGGSFLLAKLIWKNLAAQNSEDDIWKELEPHVFPDKINSAYERIMDRISNEVSDARDSKNTVLAEVLTLLGWIVCAKRPLRWNEIQCMKSIDLNAQGLKFQTRKFFKPPKDLCASLVEVRSDGTVELVHITAKYFLVEKCIDLKQTELSMACLCIDYLNLPAFYANPSEEMVLAGEYAFMDYAVVHWLQHVEAGGELLKIQSDSDDNDDPTPTDDILDELKESMSVFIERYWKEPRKRLRLADRHSAKIQFFEEEEFYGRFVQAVSSTKLQLKHFVRSEDVALRIDDMVKAVRAMVEKTWIKTSGASTRLFMEEMYGTHVFKCLRLHCQYFAIGFPKLEEQETHVARHERPYRCLDKNCIGYHFGYSTEQEKDRHVQDAHPEDRPVRVQEFPTEVEVERSLNPPPEVVDLEQPYSPSHGIMQEGQSDDALPEVELEEPPYPSYLDAVPGPRPAAKRQRTRQTEFVCSHCDKKFNRRYNLTSHLATHAEEREHICEVCGRGFARPSDLTRHSAKHTGEKRFICRGQLRDGTNYGCGKGFARADILAAHHKSRTGQNCIRAFLQQQQQSRVVPVGISESEQPDEGE